MPTEVIHDARHCAPVLARMIDILTAEPNVQFGEALAKAQLDTGVLVPEHMESIVITTAFKIITSRKFPGAPDA